MIFTIFLVVLIVLILLFNYRKSRENFETCIMKNYIGDNITTPITVIKTEPKIFNFQDDNIYINPDIVYTLAELEDVLTQITTVLPKNKYSEIPGFKYDYFKGVTYQILEKSNYEPLINKLYTQLSSKIIAEAYHRKPKYCNAVTPCNMELVDYRIVRMAKSNNGNKMIEGQLIIGIMNKVNRMIFNFVISDEDGFSIHNLKLYGYQPISVLENQEKNHLYEEKFLNIYSNPLINKYGVDKGYYYNSEGIDILIHDKAQNDILKSRNSGVLSNEYNFVGDEYRCYGKKAINKNTCETLYDIGGNRLPSVGIWDRECKQDTECPFYKSNKNYPNNFGGCINGRCQMPIGIDQVSPMKYNNLGNALCYNCLDGNTRGYNCCIDQRDKNIYPKLLSPDYKFENDQDIRIKYSEDIKKRGLNTL